MSLTLLSSLLAGPGIVVGVTTLRPDDDWPGCASRRLLRLSRPLPDGSESEGPKAKRPTAAAPAVGTLFLRRSVKDSTRTAPYRMSPARMANS